MGFPRRFSLLAALATALAGLVLVACSGDDDPVGEKAAGEALPSPVVTGQPSPEPPSHIIADDLPDPADMSQERAAPTPPPEPITDEEPTQPLPHTEETNPSPVEETGSTPVQTLDDAASCPPSDHSCFLVVGVDDCLELRAYPSFEGEVLDCVPNGTKLFQSVPHERFATYYNPFTRGDTVWYPLRADVGHGDNQLPAPRSQWPSWVEARFLQGKQSGVLSQDRATIALLAPADTDADACVPGDKLIFLDSGASLLYFEGTCFAVVGVDDCLQVRERPGPDSAILDCVPQGTRFLVADYPKTAVENADGVVWRSVRWGDRRLAGWVNSSHLDGPTPTTVVPLGQPLPTVEFPDDIVLIASPYPGPE